MSVADGGTLPTWPGSTSSFPVVPGDRGTRDELAETETGGATIYETAQLLAALRMWAQSHCRPDRVVREILETLDPVTLGEVAAELRAVGKSRRQGRLRDRHDDGGDACWTAAGGRRCAQRAL